jgi:hypothetical protein
MAGAYAGQIGQPIPLYYGRPAAGVTTVALEAGYDYVLTSILLCSTGVGGFDYFTISDESEVPLLFVALDAANAAYPQTYVFSGEAPIGPRTALNLYSELGNIFALIGGVAVTPQSILHI